jgi:hypothetical protein
LVWVLGSGVHRYHVLIGWKAQNVNQLLGGATDGINYRLACVKGTSCHLVCRLGVPLRGTKIRGGGYWGPRRRGAYTSPTARHPQIANVRVGAEKDSTYNRVDGSSKAASSWPPAGGGRGNANKILEHELFACEAIAEAMQCEEFKDKAEFPSFDFSEWEE